MFENDIFISYAHIDDQALIEGTKGWISSFHRALEIRLAQLLGRQPRIWRDPKLAGNDIFGDRLLERLPRVALLVTIVSPRYVRSEWCMKELNEFFKATEGTGGARVKDKIRIFKIIKTPVPLEQHPAALQEVLGYEFVSYDPETGRSRELAQDGDPELQRLYWAKLDDLAHDISDLLEGLASDQEGAAAPRAEEVRGTVYLATTSLDLREDRDAIRREIQGHGFRVVPDRPLPLVGPDCEEMIREELEASDLAIHLIGGSYGLIPEGANTSQVEIQNELAIQHSQKEDFRRLIWMPPGLESEDERQQRFIEHVVSDVRIQEGADLFQTPFEDFKAAIHRALAPPEEVKVEEEGVEDSALDSGGVGELPGDDLTRIYLICDQRDGEDTMALEDYLFDQGFEVMVPIFEGDQTQVRKDHEENLAVCDAVMLYYGTGNELWLRRKLREVQKSAAFGRKKPLKVKAIYVAGTPTPQKRRLRTREALVLHQGESFDPEVLAPFVSQLTGDDQSRESRS